MNHSHEERPVQRSRSNQSLARSSISPPRFGITSTKSGIPQLKIGNSTVKTGNSQVSVSRSGFSPPRSGNCLASPTRSNITMATSGSRSNLATRHTLSSLQKHGTSSASVELKDVLEKKIEDMSRLLAEERQMSRQNKMAVSRLQRELARAKSHDRPGKEHLSKELEHEKMLRLEAERRLREMTRESESCHSRLETLQMEFKKMEGMVHEMVQYKSKIDQLKQEKSSLSMTYDSNLHKFKGHITDLEHENMVLLNEVKKLESQMSSSGKSGGGQDRYKLLLERLRMVEGENSSLVLENEQQRGQYEKCLDEIANQVVQALLAQKMLREECLKLQDRVQELEVQNNQLCVAYSHCVKTPMDGSVQDGSVFDGSIESLHSMFSEQTADAAGAPQMSSPSPWLQERLPGDRRSIVSFTGSVMSTPDMDLDYTTEQNEFRCRTKIETEFPATPSSPKSKHVSIMERKNENKRSSSTSSLLPTKLGPNRQRTLSTSSLSRGRGLSITPVPPTGATSHDSGIHAKSTNQQSVNQGNLNLANQHSSMTNQSGQNCVTTLHVPLNQSNPNFNNHSSSQGQLSHSSSRIPTLPSGKTKEDVQLRRNSLKAEYSIRLGSQSPTIKTSPSPTPSAKAQQLRSSSQGSRSNLTIQGQGHSRSPSVTSARSSSVGSTASGKSQTSGSRIPMTPKSTKSAPKENIKALENSKLSVNNSSVSKIIPPKSPAMRHTGIRTTLKTENINKPSVKPEIQKPKSYSSNPTANSVHTNLKTVYAITPVVSSKVSNSSEDSGKPVLPVRGNKPVHHRPDSHFPIMGLTTLNHTSPKTEEAATRTYANIVPVSNVPCTVSSNTNVPQPSQIYASNGAKTDQNESSTLTKGQGHYFYDYSDEESDCQMTRRVSKDLSIASTVSLDELLDRTLENISTPLDSEFSSGMFNSTQTLGSESLNGANDVENKLLCENVKRENVNEQNVKRRSKSQVAEKRLTQSMNSRLSGKPDIVKDTEECEQRKLQNSIPISEIPGSSIPGYRAKRPKSLILGAKEKKFLYCEYGSSSSSDNSDQEWSCKFSYAKNVKQQEIQSKVAKSVKAGEAKVIESPKTLQSTYKDNNSSKVKNVTEKQAGKSQLPKPSGLKKPSKIPPPVATKPVQRKSALSKTDHAIPRPKSVEICVNTALSVSSKTFNPFLENSLQKDYSKAESDHSLSSKSRSRSDHGDMTSSTTFDDVKVERSGSKDDGYSTMSSDIQPEHLEKFSDAFESSTNSNEARNSNLSLSSQNSYSSEDRLSGHGSLGRVKAMKMKYELENQRSDHEVSPTKSPPTSPARSFLKSPKSVSEQITIKCNKYEISQEKQTSSKIPKSRASQLPVKENTNRSKSAIPLPKSMSSANATGKVDTVQVPHAHKVEVKIPVKNELKTTIVEPIEQNIQRKSFPITNPNLIASSTPVRPVMSSERNITPKLSPIISIPPPHIIQQQPVINKNLTDQFDQLSFFDKIEFLKDPSYDSNSSLSDRGSDLTSLHISEDNILSDIPEEKDGYESSVRSENASFSSLPDMNSVRKSPQQKASHSHNATVRHNFSMSRKSYWSSCQGLVRAARDSDYHKQKMAKESVDYEELYGGCLNIETLLERSSSESDIYTRGDKPEVTLFPRLQRSMSAECIVIDEISVEERVQAISKLNFMQQICKNVASADKDGECFSSFVELLIQRGHVMNSQPPTPEALKLNEMTVSNFSSKGLQSVSPGSFGTEERSEAELPPLGEDQKKFNSQFYSLCNPGSNRSISERAESVNSENVASQLDKSGKIVKSVKKAEEIIHTCQNGDRNCKMCESLKNQNEFDTISKQIESLSKTVNELHRSLSSLNSEVSDDSGSESNEGDVAISTSAGNKDVDDYHWVEDEFFLSPYDGEIILGSSPFSKTGASCDWINGYAENTDHVEEDDGGQEALHEEPIFDIPVELDMSLKSDNRNPMQNSIISDSMDKEGNFDSMHFITQRLQKEEERLKSMKDSDNKALLFSQDVDITVPIQKLRSSMTSGSGSRSRPRPLLKEDLRVTPEKDLDDTEHFSGKTVDRSYGGSQDSLDDNIGVDNVMCHRLLGGKAAHPGSSNRPPLGFSNEQFMRYEAPEKQAMAAFDFLQDMTSSHSSDQSNELKMSHGKFSAMEERKSVSLGYQYQMNQSTTSTDSKTSPVKQQRRKLRQRSRKEQMMKRNREYKSARLSSTSNDESNDDISLSDSISSSDDEGIVKTKLAAKKMTYL